MWNTKGSRCNWFFRFAREAGEDAKAGNCDAAKQISDVRDRKLLPGPSLSNQCAANVQDLQTREFFEAFEGTSEPSVRALVVGKKLIRIGGQHFL